MTDESSFPSEDTSGLPIDASSASSSDRKISPVIVAVAGATGLVGQHVVRSLLALPSLSKLTLDGKEIDPSRSNFVVRILSRDVAKAETLFDTKGRSDGKTSRLDIVKGDVTQPDSLRSLVDGASYLICTIGARAFTGAEGPIAIDEKGVKNLVTACVDEKKKQKGEQSSINRFVLISSASVTKTFSFINLFGFAKPKLEAENFLRQSGIDYTVIRPPVLTNSSPVESATKRAIFTQGDNLVFIGTMSRYNTAQLCLLTLLNPKAKNRTFECREGASGENFSVDGVDKLLGGIKGDGVSPKE